MISKVYIVSCDQCRNKMEVLQVTTIGGAFKAARKLKWRSNAINTVHVCPECQIAVAKKANAKAIEKKVKP